MDRIVSAVVLIIVASVALAAAGAVVNLFAAVFA